jgi:hypothetical protein
VIAQSLTKDERVRLMAATIMLERGFGKAEQKADVAVPHQFVKAPQVMEQAEWLARRGDGAQGAAAAQWRWLP